MSPPSNNLSKKKVSAFQLPEARGKGDILPALEKDMLEPVPSFRNLSQLIKMREKEKFYAENNQKAQEILQNIGGDNNNDTNKWIVKDG